MGDVFAGGGASAPPYNYHPAIIGQYAAWMNDINPWGTPTGSDLWYSTDAPDYALLQTNWATIWGTQDFNVQSKMVEVSRAVGGSPYALAVSYDPEPVLVDIEDRLGEFGEAVDAYDPEAVIETAVQLAVRLTDDDVLTDEEVTAAVNAFDTRSKSDVLMATSRVMAGLHDMRAVMTTQSFQAVANLEQEHQNRLAEFETKIRLADYQRRYDIVTSVMSSVVQAYATQLQSRQALTGAAIDVGKVRILSKNDQIQMDLQYETQDTLWDLELFAYGQNMLASIYGAAVLPRAQTKGERLLAALTGSASFGIQIGAMTGNPVAGVAGGGISFLMQSLLLGV